ncbi:hypothetical protein PENCOP_c004G05506 [Penicillium coprophilum]|uniref:Uncharacterized protein n=1 Tax=Penicillium coprophilum TaxID=36646 RepID=A0A1V6UU13_9EURO|nr:hypothetical protein PENCOP_c004G05506 [Penicillium coprophilum]
MDPTPIKLDNSGTDNRFAHGITDWRQTPQLFLRELCMLQFMSYVTEQPEWENKCEEPQTLEEWHQHVDSVFDLDETSWQWCVRELRDKASDLKRTAYVAVFDADPRVIKSQISGDLLKQLRESTSPFSFRN